MNDKRKMNLPYKIAFVLLILSLPVFGASMLIAYVAESIIGSVICSGIGAFLLVLGIILACVSKEKTTEISEDVNGDFVENKVDETIDKI